MITYQEVQKILSSLARSFGKENIPLEQASGRVLSEKVVADRDYPPFNRAAMDGYAFCYEDFQKGIRDFVIKEIIYAGQQTDTRIGAGQCYKIMTGAAVPAGADVVIRREDTEEQTGSVKILTTACCPFQHIARRGEDLQEGETIIDKPVFCTPPVISLLAAIGKETITVEKIPAVAIITTGNEVMPINSTVSPVQIRNSNAWLMKALLAKQQVIPVSAEHVVDDKMLLKQAFEKVMGADMIITSGAVSAGDADYIPGVVEALGVKKLLHKVAIKPGKPVWCGQLPDGGLLFALPGNPLSCLVTFTIFVQHYLHTCYGVQSRPLYEIYFTGRKK